MSPRIVLVVAIAAAASAAVVYARRKDWKSTVRFSVVGPVGGS
jgi:hypothetical protein